jgi:hypothetical protein
MPIELSHIGYIRIRHDVASKLLAVRFFPISLSRLQGAPSQSHNIVLLSTSRPVTPMPDPNPTDPDFVLETLSSHGLQIKDPKSPRLFTAAAELGGGTITPEQFLKVALPLVKAVKGEDGSSHLGINSEGIKAIFGFASQWNPVVAAGMGVLMELQKASTEIKKKSEAALLQQRFLGAMEHARKLEPQSVQIVVAVKEALEDAFDDHEVAYLQADSASIRDFLREETVPFLKAVEIRGVEKIPIDLIRRQRRELKEKLEIQRKNVNVHLQRIEKGIDNMASSNYFIKTNHLPRYAAAASLEVLLRGYYVLLGRLDLP